MATGRAVGDPAIFEAAIRAALDRWCSGPIKWGRDDCLMGLAEVVRVATGRDVGKPYRGRYRSAGGAVRVLGPRGVPGALAKAARSLRWPSLPPARCQNGAIGYIETPAGPAGVMRLGNMWVGRFPSGFSMFPSSEVRKAWGYE